MDITDDIQPLANFLENSTELIRRLKTTQQPMILTFDGEPQAILQDPASYQRLLNLAAAADANEGIRQGLQDIAAGRSRPAKEFFDEFRKKHNIPR